MPRKTLSDRGVAALKPPAGVRFAHPDPEMPGHYVRLHPSGAKSFVAVTTGADGKQKWITVGKVGTLTIGEARVRAREAIRRVRAGLPAFEVPPGRPATFGEVAQSWLDRRVRKEEFRSEREIVRILGRAPVRRYPQVGRHHLDGHDRGSARGAPGGLGARHRSRNHEFPCEPHG
jgi:hypothetical protein